MCRAVESVRSTTDRVNKSCCGISVMLRVNVSCHAVERTQCAGCAWTEEETGCGRTVSKELKSKVGQLITYSLFANTMSQGRLG